jgi:phosphate transport system protein
MITRMAEIAQKMLRESLDAYARRDVQLAQRVLIEDEEEDLLKAKALTELITLIRTDPPRSEAFVELILLSKNMERIGDHATNIAEDVVYMVLGKDIRHGHSAMAH